jgi:hypothetical protein
MQYLYLAILIVPGPLIKDACVTINVLESELNIENIMVREKARERERKEKSETS